MPKAHILVAEDDTHIREGLVDLLEGEGYTVTATADGRAALQAFRGTTPDLLLLDIMMPCLSGYDVCREVRKSDARVPIVMLTAKSEEIDKVVGLELGADDYVTKPFGVRELLARIAARLRHAQAQKPKPDPDDAQPDVFGFGAAEISRRSLRGKLGERSFDLTARELALLEYFAARPGAALSREKLLQAVWGYEYTGTTRTLDQHIAQLRKKIEPAPDAPRVITTVHGIGYRYEGEPG